MNRRIKAPERIIIKPKRLSKKSEVTKNRMSEMKNVIRE